MGINKYLKSAKKDFHVYGEIGDSWHKYNKDADYEGFAVLRKKWYIYIMTIKELNKRKTPIVIIDKSLEEYKGKILFPEKLAKANEVLKKIGLPKLTDK